MTSRLPRIALTVPEDLKAVLTFTADQTGMPISKLVVGILEESKAQILAIGKAVQAAKEDPLKSTGMLQKMLDEANGQLGEAQLDLEDEIKIQKIKAKKTARKKATK